MKMTLKLIWIVYLHFANEDRPLSLIFEIRTVQDLSRTAYFHSLFQPQTFQNRSHSNIWGRPLFPRTVHFHLDLNFSRKKPFQGISMAKSEEYSSYATNLFFNDLESVHAKRFQDRNLTLSIYRGPSAKMISRCPIVAIYYMIHIFHKRNKI